MQATTINTQAAAIEANDDQLTLTRLLNKLELCLGASIMCNEIATNGNIICMKRYPVAGELMVITVGSSKEVRVFASYRHGSIVNRLNVRADEIREGHFNAICGWVFEAEDAN